ncbi:MAG: SDR family oxidoreductase [Euryarchaeota archaeon]|nr:SDR family oxidoreductase [Euryarchaeota archaeon]
MSILVTGGAGFIGSHIVDSLISEGHDVIVLDDLSEGKREHVNKSAKFYKSGLNDAGLGKIFQKEKIEVVFHQAAQVSVRESLDNPIFDADVNIKGTINLLECCREVDKIIYASSGGAVYGEPKYLPVDEEHPTNPLSPYGVSKYIAEKYLQVYKELYGLNYAALRYGNVYGPRQDPYGEAGVVAIFANKMLRSERPMINGDGTQTRDFVYVSDIVRANLLAIERGKNIYNITAGKETSVNEIFAAIKKILNTNVEPEHAPPIKGEVRRIYLNIEKAERELGWKPEVELEEGIKNLLEYMRQKI